MNKARLSADLTEAELDRLGQSLSQFPGAMNLETMDGFFSALICAPERVPMGEVMSQGYCQTLGVNSRDVTMR